MTQPTMSARGAASVRRGSAIPQLERCFTAQYRGLGDFARRYIERPDAPADEISALRAVPTTVYVLEIPGWLSIKEEAL